MALQNLERTKARLLALPASVKVAVAAQLDAETSDFVDQVKAAAPVGGDLEQRPGELRDSVHKYANPDRELSFRVLADAKDDKGRFIGAHVEFGHKSKDGKHVPAQPFFFPTYRARKKAMRRRMLAAGRKAAKAAFDGQ